MWQAGMAGVPARNLPVLHLSQGRGAWGRAVSIFVGISMGKEFGISRPETGCSVETSRGFHLCDSGAKLLKGRRWVLSDV